MPEPTGLFFGARSGVVSYREPGRPQVRSRLIRAAQIVDSLSREHREALLATLEPDELRAALEGNSIGVAAAEGLIDRRNQPRREFFERARMIAGEGAVEMECRVLEWSPQGRRLRMTAPVEPPRSFQLIGEGMAAPRAVEVIWQQRETVGVRFCA